MNNIISKLMTDNNPNADWPDAYLSRYKIIFKNSTNDGYTNNIITNIQIIGDTEKWYKSYLSCVS